MADLADERLPRLIIYHRKESGIFRLRRARSCALPQNYAATSQFPRERACSFLTLRVSRRTRGYPISTALLRYKFSEVIEEKVFKSKQAETLDRNTLLERVSQNLHKCLIVRSLHRLERERVRNIPSDQPDEINRSIVSSTDSFFRGFKSE